MTQHKGLILTHLGGIGDHVFSIPALLAVRPYFKKIYMYSRKNAPMIFENTGLIDGFLFRPEELCKETEALGKELKKLDPSDPRHAQLTKEWDEGVAVIQKHIDKQCKKFNISHSITLHGTVPDRFLFHGGSKGFSRDIQWRRKINSGINYYDEFSKRILQALDPEAPENPIKRPIFVLSKKERKFIKDFRKEYGIPQNARIVTIQLVGSSRNKWYPYFQDTAVEIMQRHPDVYIMGTGGIDSPESDIRLLKWKEPRFRNLGGISFRETMCVVTMSELLISPETGVFNLAGALLTPKILLATHTSGDQIASHFLNCSVIRSGAKCSPCYQIHADCPEKPKGKPWCLCVDRIHPQRVADEASKWLEKKKDDLMSVGKEVE